MNDIPHPNWAPYSGIKPLAETIHPWPWTTARAAWLRRACQLLPSLRGDKVTVRSTAGSTEVA